MFADNDDGATVDTGTTGDVGTGWATGGATADSNDWKSPLGLKKCKKNAS